MAGRNASGEGSLYRRRDGRWAGAAFVDTVSGQRKRIHVYAATRQEVHDRLADKLVAARQGVRTPDKEWTVGAYLDYWLTTVVAVKNRPRTAELYASTVRLHIQPALGTIRLTKLTVQNVQAVINTHLTQGRSQGDDHARPSTQRPEAGRFGIVQTRSREGCADDAEGQARSEPPARGPVPRCRTRLAAAMEATLGVTTDTSSSPRRAATKLCDTEATSRAEDPGKEGNGQTS
jgi:hypothetical protein